MPRHLREHLNALDRERLEALLPSSVAQRVELARVHAHVRRQLQHEVPQVPVRAAPEVRRELREREPVPLWVEGEVEGGVGVQLGGVVVRGSRRAAAVHEPQRRYRYGTGVGRGGEQGRGREQGREEAEAGGLVEVQAAVDREHDARRAREERGVWE